MIKTATKHYDALCDMPSCMCVACEVYLFLTRGLVTTGGSPYILGTVVSITEVPSGGLDMVVSYDDATLPVDPDTGVKLVITFPTGAQDGTACDPDCKSDCAWMSKVIALIAGGVGGVINKEYQLYAESAHVVNGAFDLPRTCFPTGYKLSDVRISCWTYDVDTTADFRLLVGATVIATYSGNLSEQKQFTILHDTLDYDKIPVLEITNLVNGTYGDFALGLVLELIGVIAP